MIEIKKFPCYDRREATSEEDKIMRELKATMNKSRPYLLPEEIKQYRIEWRERNKEAVKEYNRLKYIRLKQEKKETNTILIIFEF